MLEHIADELMRRMAADQHARGWINGRPAADPDPERIRAVDSDNVAALKRIIAQHGWPGVSLVGTAAAHAAWLIAQHADEDPAFQEKALDLLSQAVKAGEAQAADWAYLTDRCLVHRGRPQQYGTQYTSDEHGLRPQPIADPATLDDRRAAVGLGPHADYDTLMRSGSSPQPPSPPPQPG